MLTREMIAEAFPEAVPDDRTAMSLMTEAEIDANRQEILAVVAPHEDIWLFAYGSLMWKPEPEFAEHRAAQLDGWHRSFCIWQWRYRGTRQNPGLMMGLDSGGSCEGKIFRIPAPDASARLTKVWQREMIGKAYRPIWVDVKSEDKLVRAVTFVVEANSQRYAGEVPETEAARYIASACGHIGPNAEYLLETYRHCVESGIDDPMLARLQHLVAQIYQDRAREQSTP